MQYYKPPGVIITMEKTLYILLVLACGAVFSACTDDDSFSTSPSNLLTFSTDTVRLDTVFATVPSSTRTFWVYNKSGDGIRCATVRLVGGNQTGFRVNVDGEYLSPEAGYQVRNVEIRNGDSIRVFVELTSPKNMSDGPQLTEDDLVFLLESGVEQKVNLNAYTWNATLLSSVVISGEQTIDSHERPVVIYGGLKVDSMATLHIAPGTTLYFHSDAGIDVYGRLISEGTADEGVILRGDRTDKMFDYLPYDMVSGQWRGIRLHSSSYGNKISYTDIHGTFDGIVCDSSDVSQLKLQLHNSTVHNCQGDGLRTYASMVDVKNCQLTNTLGNCVAVYGGDVSLTHCTIAQFYPFDSNRGAALMFTNFDGTTMLPLERMDCINSIVTGYGEDMLSGVKADGETTFNYRFVNSIIRTPEVDDDGNFIDVYFENIEDTAAISGEENFRLVDIDLQRYDFHLAVESPAIGAANKDYSLPEDRDGLLRDDAPDIGCYEYWEQDNSSSGM